MSKNTAVFGIYSSGIAVEEGANTLRREGFRATDISVLFPDNKGSKDLAHEKSTKAPEGAAAGMGAGSGSWWRARMARRDRYPGNPRLGAAGRRGTDPGSAGRRGRRWNGSRIRRRYDRTECTRVRSQ